MKSTCEDFKSEVDVYFKLKAEQLDEVIEEVMM